MSLHIYIYIYIYISNSVHLGCCFLPAEMRKS